MKVNGKIRQVLVSNQLLFSVDSNALFNHHYWPVCWLLIVFRSVTAKNPQQLQRILAKGHRGVDSLSRSESNLSRYTSLSSSYFASYLSASCSRASAAWVGFEEGQPEDEESIVVVSSVARHRWPHRWAECRWLISHSFFREVTWDFSNQESSQILPSSSLAWIRLG